MMDFVARKARLIEDLQTQIMDTRVLNAMRRIPRECFVPDHYESSAYEDEPLPIGCDQTISQPLIIAMMTQALELTGGEKVLEVGTGSGYQAAVLAELAREVISVERIPSLAGSARRILRALGYSNIKICLSGNRLGWEADAPYGGIIVTAGAPGVPADLLKQLAIGGKMVIPVGPRDVQELCQITRLNDGNVVRKLGGCRFVPLIGEDAWEEI
jgi:protein-L-isoaspartate(D-aspartate) O-methyltransferase